MKKLMIALLLLASGLQAKDTLENDKIEHFLAGYAIADVTTVYMEHMGFEHWTAQLIGFSTGTAAGILKESIDSTQPHNKFDVVDLSATMLGAGLNIAIHLKW